MSSQAEGPSPAPSQFAFEVTHAMASVFPFLPSLCLSNWIIASMTGFEPWCRLGLIIRSVDGQRKSSVNGCGH